MIQEPALERFAKSKASERTITANHAMTRDDQTNWVRGIGAADCARCRGIANLRREFSIAAGFTEWNFSQRRPDSRLKRRAVRRKEQGEFSELACAICEHLITHGTGPGLVVRQLCRRTRRV